MYLKFIHNFKNIIPKSPVSLKGLLCLTTFGKRPFPRRYASEF